MSQKFKVLIYSCLIPFIVSLGYSQTTTYDTIKVDLGSNVTEGGWNNLTNSDGTGEITMLKNSRNLYTAMGINVYDKFNGINTSGTTTPDASIGFPSTATSDSYFGNTVEFSGSTEPTGGLLFSGLNPSKQYTFEIFASRLASDNRETKYKFNGAALDSVLLNPSNNTANTVSVTMQPKEDGTIDLIVSPGPNNNNSYGFYYLGALKMIYEQEDVLPPAITLTAPNGGEELTGKSNYNIAWDAINLKDDVVVNYSTNNGASWNEIATVDSSQTSLEWLVPNITSNNCLVQVVSGTASDQSDSVFTIVSGSSVVNDTILVDLGSNISAGAWNNFTDAAGSGEIPALINSRNLYTAIGCNISDRFNGINLNGTTTPDPNLNLPSTATSDSYYGNTAVWGGLVEPTAALLFTGMDVSKAYTFEVFASRMGVSDNRETKYKFIGGITDSIYLNAANNQSEIATITLQPAADGSIKLQVSAGENNNNSYSFYYLTALKIIYEQEESAPLVTVTSPNGGEEWTRGTVQKITWVSNDINNVKIEYSADNGSSWDSVGTAAASVGKFDWTLPDAKTDSALVKITAVENSEISDVSNNVFKIDDPISGEFRPLIVVLGSSTAAGTGPTSPDSAWVWRYRSYVQSLDKDAYVVNLAVGGYTTYDIMPTGYVPPTGRPTPKPNHNITYAMTYKPSAIIINLPSNDAAQNIPIPEQLANYDTIWAHAGDTPLWVTTTQPRNFSTQAQRDQLMYVRDFTYIKFGDHTIDFWTGLANTDGTINSAYNSGDGVHINNAGHRVFFQRVVEKKIWDYITDIDAGEVNESNLPIRFELRQNYPNPFNPTTTIVYSLAASGKVQLVIYNVMGQKELALVNNFQDPGTYMIQFDGAKLSSGIYFYQLSINNFIQTRKMLLLR